MAGDVPERSKTEADPFALCRPRPADVAPTVEEITRALQPRAGVPNLPRMQCNANDFGQLLDEAYGAADGSLAARLNNAYGLLSGSVTEAYSEGGESGVQALQNHINEGVKTPNVGPMFVVNGDSIEIHHVQMVPSDKVPLDANGKPAAGYLQLQDGQWAQDIVPPKSVAIEKQGGS